MLHQENISQSSLSPFRCTWTQPPVESFGFDFGLEDKQLRQKELFLFFQELSRSYVGFGGAKIVAGSQTSRGGNRGGAGQPTQPLWGMLILTLRHVPAVRWAQGPAQGPQSGALRSPSSLARVGLVVMQGRG